MVERKNKVVDQTCSGIDFLMDKNKIDVHHGVGSFVDKNTIKVVDSEGKETELKTDKTIIATGSKPNFFKGMEPDKDRIITSTEALSLKENDTALLCLSPVHIAGKMMIVRAMEIGMNLIVSEPSANPLKLINQKIDFCAMVPIQVATTRESNPGKFELIKKLIIGGAPLSELDQEYLEFVSTQSYVTYGMTETVSHVALKRITETDTAPKSTESPQSIHTPYSKHKCCHRGTGTTFCSSIVASTDSVNFDIFCCWYFCIQWPRFPKCFRPDTY